MNPQREFEHEGEQDCGGNKNLHNEIYSKYFDDQISRSNVIKHSHCTVNFLLFLAHRCARFLHWMRHETAV